VYGVTKVTGDSQLQTDVLEDLSDARRYRTWLADLARPHLGNHPIEIGSGTGEYALEWAPLLPAFTASEADASRHRALYSRFEGHDVIRVRYLLLGDEASDAADEHSAAVAFNVLEHIPDDVAALRAMRQLVRPGGAIVLIVPAFPSAMSRFDLAIGHQRRYTRRSLGEALSAAGLAVEQLRYVNPIGLLNWYVTVKAIGMRPRNGAALRLYDRMVVPIARTLDRFSVPFGQSVFAVARVPTA
jgi:SAM-dependent methyltransferase